MTAGKKLIILRLEGALQSWDDTSKWDERGTAGFPSKSGIVGMLGCAMGLERGNPRLAMLSDAITLYVRADRPGSFVTDFQTVTGDPLRNAEGKPKTTGNTIISRRTYLQDACFTVVLEVEDGWYDSIVEGLRDPKWSVYLGRKACVPSRPVLEDAAPSYSDGMEALYGYPCAKGAVERMPFEAEVEDGRLSGSSRPDALTGQGRSFMLRKVYRGVIREGRDVSE